MNKPVQFEKYLVLFCNTIFIFIIYLVVFIFITEFSIMFKYVNNIDDDKFYIYNFNDVDTGYTVNDNKEASLYFIDYFEVNDEYLQIIYMNDNAVKNGIPIFYENVILFFDVLDENFTENTIYTNDINLKNEKIEYKNYFNDFQIQNFFMDLDVTIPYICVTNDISSPTLSVYNRYPPKSNSFSYNAMEANSMFVEGKYMKNCFYQANNFYISVFEILSIIPIVFLMIAVANIYSYFFSKEQDCVIIQHIYYLNQKMLIRKYFKKLYKPICISSILAIILAWVIIIHNNFFILLVAVIVCLALQCITIFLIARRNVLKNMKGNLWRKIND